jgi:hypothetical protein
MKRKLLTETSRVSSRMFGYYKYTTGLSFAEERIGPLAAIVTTVFYLLVLYLLVLPITPENLFASIHSESLIKTTHQHHLLLVGFDTLIYRKYYDTPPILVGHHAAGSLARPGVRHCSTTTCSAVRSSCLGLQWPHGGSEYCCWLLQQRPLGHGLGGHVAHGLRPRYTLFSLSTLFFFPCHRRQRCLTSYFFHWSYYPVHPTAHVPHKQCSCSTFYN